jgi:hypothetical protein
MPSMSLGLNPVRLSSLALAGLRNYAEVDTLAVLG